MLTDATSASGSPAPAPVPALPAAAAVPGAAVPVATVHAGWAWPVGPAREMVRPFEAPASRYAAGHRGIDLLAGEGHPVRSPADGVVTFVGRVVDRPVLSIQHGEDLVSSFEPVTATVSEGDRVLAGQIVGVVATGSHCTARCVHFGVRRHGQYISPMLFLGGLARAVLLPLPPTGPMPYPAR
ncbi:M23 family metallopeptidase [Cryobacterium adonitolivorans]|uniref:M23 family metallopeptidase n=2 Tax=Cryobacterium adonitolivorans TaxID=1259189 RepID=A0A4R8VXQ1_9MICO|nr:M23 family metallopeptidase [Cryobacterium adonitolivorans]